MTLEGKTLATKVKDGEVLLWDVAKLLKQQAMK
jgi:hypothetical protein